MSPVVLRIVHHAIGHVVHEVRVMFIYRWACLNNIWATDDLKDTFGEMCGAAQLKCQSPYVMSLTVR